MKFHSNDKGILISIDIGEAETRASCTLNHLKLSLSSQQGDRLPLSLWMAHASDTAQMAVAKLLTWVASDEAYEEDFSVRLTHSKILELPDHEAVALGLPERSQFSLKVESDGTLSDPGYQIRWSLKRSGIQTVVISERVGAFIRVGKNWSRLPATHFNLITACERINATLASHDLNERMRAYATLKDYLPQTPGEGVVTSPLLQQFQVFDAGAFSLRMRIEHGRLAFDPVLYARRPASTGDMLTDTDIEPDPLLTNAASEAFVNHLAENTSRYALGGNRFLVLSPHLSRAMTTVKRLRDSQDAEGQRRLFLQPSAVLREEFARDLGEEGLDDILGSLFLETKAYLADRVIGIGIWQKPVLPWIQRRGNDWFPPEDDDLPPSSGLRVETPNGPVDLPLRKAEAEQLREKVQQAIAAKHDFVEHKGQRLPANADTLKALDLVINPLKKPLTDTDAKFALLIEGNYETVGCGQTLAVRGLHSASALPSGLRSELKEHQLHGLRWLQDAWKQGMPGVLLADDMGLGKTIQALTFLAWLKENIPASSDTNAGGVLIVAPTSLLYNWKAEHEKHLEQPGLGDVLQVHGSHLRHVRQPTGKGLNVETLRQADWVLTTYETLKGYQTDFGSVRFRCVVLDEAQKVKSPDTQVTSAAKALNAEFKIAMTGTPVENRRADLWCVSDAVYPGLLGSLKDFSADYERDESREAAAKLKILITTATADSATPQPFMLRRMKQEILDGLPSKASQSELCDMPPAQAACYSEVIATARGNSDPGAKLQAIHSLRMASLHPWLVSEDVDTGGSLDLDAFVSNSARLISLSKILNIIRQCGVNGEKALVFVNSRIMQTWLRIFLAKAFGLPDVALINGTTPSAQRQAAVDRFQTAPPGFGLMLLAPKAAGVGLTITAANHVIHLERWWNPAVEDQCTDRAYRIGQDKPVTIWLPQAVHPDVGIKDHSFDLRLHSLLEHKRLMSRDLLAPVENSAEDTSQLFAETVGNVGNGG
jgi:superfamily II DNA or RNA helicase